VDKEGANSGSRDTFAGVHNWKMREDRLAGVASRFQRGAFVIRRRSGHKLNGFALSSNTIPPCPAYGAVHHLTVAAYMVQHSSNPLAKSAQADSQQPT